MAQFFKGDAEELKYYESGKVIAQSLSLGKSEFFDDAYACFVLGDLLWDEKRSPLANAIRRDIFRQSFSTIYDSFVEAGSFESYLTVFRKIFGDAVEITFTVPAPGKLEIDIVATDVELSEFIARNIVENNYQFDNVIDDEGDFIVFQSIKGFDSQYELEQMLFEMVPDGIYTEITLTIGE